VTVNLSVKDLRELLEKHQAGDPLTLDGNADEISIHIPTSELPELLKGSPAAGRAKIEKLETNAIHIRVTDPVKAMIKLSDFRLHADKVSAQTDLNLFVRKAVEMFLRAKNIQKAYLDGKRIVIRIHPKVSQMVELKRLTIESSGITVVGKLK